MIGYGRQDIDRDDCRAVLDALKSDFLTQGPRVPAFEAAIGRYCGAKHATALSSATAALHAAYAALDVGAGDVVWTSPNTFVATASAARYLGADVDFVDIDPHSYNMSVEALAGKLAAARDGGRLPKVVAPVHFAGQSCDMAAIDALRHEYGFRVVEDASHAIGGRYRDAPVGNCAHSDIAVFSFHPVKIITTGEGGVATTNDDDLRARMDLFRSHGVTRDMGRMQLGNEGAWYYEMVELGYNYRLTDMQAALGISQLGRVDMFVARRHAIAARYNAAFAGLPIVTPRQEPWQYSGYHLYVLRWPDGAGGLTRREAFDGLRSAGIGANVHYIPVHLQPYYRGLGFGEGHCPEAEAYYREAVTIPLHPGLTEDEIETVIGAVHDLATGRAGNRPENAAAESA